MHIACIDDDDEFLDLLSWLAAERGWQASMYRNAELALREIARTPPQLIMLDLRLGEGLSGWDVIDLLRRDARTVDLPIIVCSAAVDEVQERQADLECPDVHVLAKPFDIDDLYRIVDAIVAGPDGHKLAGA